MLIYDVDKIENLYQDFEKCQKDFKNKEYDDFRSSYFYKCSDSVIVKLRNRIQTIYNNIQKGYDMIDKVWKEYVDDVGNFDKSIASGGNCGIHDGGVSSIVSKICSLDLYDSAGVGTRFKSLTASSHVSDSFAFKVTNFLKRTGATIVNVISSLCNGILKFVEGIVDCVVLIVGAVVGLVVLLVDGAISLGSGKKRNGIDTTKKYFNKLLQCVGYDVVNEKIKSKFYSTGFGKWFDENAYGPFKSSGVGYKVGEAVGEIIGTIVLTVVTCGGGAAASAAKTAATTGTKISVKAAAAAAMKTALHGGAKKSVVFAVRAAGSTGMKLQKNYNDFLDKNEGTVEKGKLDGGQMFKLMVTSTGQGVIDAGAYTLTYGNGLKDLANFKSGNVTKAISNSKLAQAIANTKVGGTIIGKAKNIASSNVVTAVKNSSAVTSIKNTSEKVIRNLGSQSTLSQTAKKVANKLGKNIGTGTTDALKNAGKAVTNFGNSGGSLGKVKSMVAGVTKYLNKNIKTETLSKAGIQVAKTYANDGLSAWADISDFNHKETATDALINAGISVGYDITASNALKEVTKLAEDNKNIDFSVSMGQTVTKESSKDFAGKAKELLAKFLNETKVGHGVAAVAKYGSKDYNGKKVIGTAIKKGPTTLIDKLND